MFNCDSCLVSCKDFELDRVSQVLSTSTTGYKSVQLLATRIYV